ncbi:BTAD domain-containing putative transcriptional regulator [Streptomyces sp. NPDC004065]|uniref:AfsR/SARP family transcriptional regulator n=1 Tax=Streptomyces sp. NPDC004065 TaxID=3364689 RepID=UPI00384D9008
MRYRFLGPLGVWRDGEEIPLAPAKWRMLLAVLLCDANQVVSTDRLVAELWDAAPPQSAGKLLQGYVSRVRRALGDESGRLLVTHAQGYRAHGYRLVVRPGEADAHRFVELVEEGGRELDRDAPEAAADRFDEALGLWRDTPFTDVPPTPAVEAETMRLAAYHTQARESRIEARLRLGRHEAVLDELDALVAEHPLREGLRGRLMLALYRSGRQADALAAYRDLRHRLAEELGIEPGPPLQQLHQRILRADAALLPEPRPPAAAPGTPERRLPVVPRELPHPSPTFVGRAGESSVLHRLLEDAAEGQLTITVIDGAGGVGKSALAVHTAHRLADRFPDGQFYVDLHGATAGLKPLEPAEVLARFLTTLGVPETAVPAGTEEAAAAFRSLVADRRLLMVLDNAAGVEQVRPLLPAGPGCAVLITSRESLTPLEGATHLHLGVMFHDQASALLERLVGAERVAREPEATDALVQLCGRLPLALRIVGARMAARPGWPLSAFVERLTDAQNRLDEIRVGDLSVRASFHAGYDGIRHSEHPTDRAAARAFRFCGVLPGPNTGLPTAAALLGVDRRQAEDALERLVDAHLLHSLAPGRYQMHDLIRLFAREQVCAEEPQDEREQALIRVLRFYLATAERAVAFLDGPWPPAHRPTGERPTGEAPAGEVPAAGLPPAGLLATGERSGDGDPPGMPIGDRRQAEAWLDAERANLTAAVTHAAAGSEPAARLALRLARPLHRYLYPHARARELRVLADTVLGAARRLGDRRAQAQGLDQLSAVHWLHRRYDSMRQCLESALALWRETGDRDGELHALGTLADALAELGRYEESVAVQHRRLALARETGDRMAQLTGMGNLGRAYQGLGRTEDALSCLRQSLAHARDTGERALESLALNEISFILFDQGRTREAQEHMRRAGLLADGGLGAYVRWRGYAWSAFFPACLTLGIDRDTERGAA